MAKGKYKVAKQNAGFAIYAAVSLEIKHTNTKKITVKFHKSVDKQWELPCLDGINYAYEKMPPQSGIEVQITELHWNPVDTKPVAVKFATAMAFWQAMNYKPHQPPQIQKTPKAFRIIFY